MSTPKPRTSARLAGQAEGREEERPNTVVDSPSLQSGVLTSPDPDPQRKPQEIETLEKGSSPIATPQVQEKRDPRIGFLSTVRTAGTSELNLAHGRLRPNIFNRSGGEYSASASMESLMTENSAAKRKRRKEEDDPDMFSAHHYQARKLPNTPLLCISSHDKRTRDIAQWFDDFIMELSDLAIPVSRWADYLKQNLEPNSRVIIQEFLDGMRKHGQPIRDGKETLLLVCDAILMRYVVAHHPGAYLCRYFNAKDFFSQSARKAYATINILKLRYNESVDRLKLAGYKAQALDDTTLAYFYLTSLSSDTTQLIRDRLPDVFQSDNPLQTLGALAAGLEKDDVWNEPFGEAMSLRKGGGVSVGFVRAGAATREQPVKIIPQPQQEQRNWKENQTLKCMYCGMMGHVEDTCRKWEKARKTYPPGTCPKCCRGKHESATCRENNGVMWITTPYFTSRGPGSNRGTVAMIREPSHTPEAVPERSGIKRTNQKQKFRNNFDMNRNLQNKGENHPTPRGQKFLRKRKSRSLSGKRRPPFEPNPNTIEMGAEKQLGDQEGRAYPGDQTRDQHLHNGAHVLVANVCETEYPTTGRVVRNFGEISKISKRSEISRNVESEKQKKTQKREDHKWGSDTLESGEEDTDLYGEIVAMVTNKNSGKGETGKLGKSPRTIAAKLIFEGKEYEAICDTGCPYTLIREEIAMEWEKDGLLKSARPHIRLLADVNGKELKFNRSIEMIMEVRGTNKAFHRTQNKFKLGIVQWLPVDFLLGMDMIKEMRFNIDLSRWDLKPENILSARDFRMFPSPIKEIRLYRVNSESIENIPEEEEREMEDENMSRERFVVEDLATTCMTVSTWSRTIGRDMKDKDLVLPMASKAELKKREKQPLQERSHITYEALKTSIFHPNPTSWTTEQRETFFQLCLEYPTIWNSGDLPLSCTSLTICHLELEGNPKAIKAAVRPMSETKKEITRGKITELLNEGIITISESTWASPVVLVPKVNNEWRLCIDYREINKLLKITSWPLPRMHQVSDRMQGVRFVCALDLLQGYYQIELTKESRHLTAFQTTEGLYEYTKLPFGLAMAPAIFQHFVDDLLGTLRPYKVEAYLDDFLLKGETWDAFLRNARDLFGRCAQAQVQFKPQKCDMGLKELAFLGYLISTEGIRPIPLKTLPVQMFEVPTTRKKLKSFLGMAGYYRRFVKDYAIKAAILHELDHNDVPFSWTSEHNTAFELLKKNICEATLLAHPDYEKTFIIDCDASNIGLGAVLSQPTNSTIEKPISFASRKLTGAETKWGATELEAFAVVWALEIFRPWIDGYQVLVRTDHSPLLWLQKNVNKTPKLARWVLKLQEFNFELQHRPGKAQVVADALSRSPLDRQPNDAFNFEAAEIGKNMFAGIKVGGNVMLARERRHRKRQKEKRNETDEPTLWRDPALIISGESRQIEPFSTARLKEEIEYCPICKWAIQKINNPDLPNAHWLRKISGTLTRDAEGRIWVVTITAGRAADLTTGAAVLHETKRLLIPSGMIQGIMQRLHGGSHGGHFGYYKTLLKLKEKFYWPSLKNDVRRFIMSCALCWSVARNPEGRLRPKSMLPTGSPGEVVAMDFFGPLPITKRNNRFILVIIDHFTRWVLVEPLKDAKAHSVTRTIIDRWIPTHGLPRIILSDNGPHFRSRTTTNLCEKLGIRNIFSTPYHPQGNGVVEAFMRPLKKILSVQVSEKGNNWDLCCSAASYAYNSTPHVTTKRSPFFLMHGFEAFLPIQRELEIPDEPKQSDIWLKALWDARRQVFEDYVVEHKKRQAALKDTGLPINSFVALRHNTNEKNDEFGKLGSLMSGPWKIVRRASNGITYFVECPATGNIRQVTIGQMRLIELPREVEEVEIGEISTKETPTTNLPLAELDTTTQVEVEPEAPPKATKVYGRVLRNTDARRANASLARQEANTRTVII